jgi:hypothetical protein
VEEPFAGTGRAFVPGRLPRAREETPRKREYLAKKTGRDLRTEIRCEPRRVRSGGKSEIEGSRESDSDSFRVTLENEDTGGTAEWRSESERIKKGDVSSRVLGTAKKALLTLLILELWIQMLHSDVA